MRSNLIGFFSVVFLLFLACRHEQMATPACVHATITNTAQSCDGWGIVVNNQTYPSSNIPDNFKQNGLHVCTEYTLYDDPAVCPCCGGTRARILTMQ